MANGEEQQATKTSAMQQETREQRTARVKEQIKKAKESGLVQTVAPGTHADAERTANGESLQETQPYVVEPRRFKLEHFRMSGIEGYVTTMTFRDVVDYCEYASELYGDSDTDVTQQWQRGISNPRIKEASNYLALPVHFFPPIVCVPATDDLQFVDNHVTLNAHVLGVLDGQHRRGAIKAYLENGGNADESIPVVILNLPSTDVERKQQIFADVNRTPRKVSKALNLVFDHSDREAALAVKIAKRPNHDESRIDFERLSPLRKANQVMSLTNLYNLIRPMAQVKTEYGDYVLSEEQLGDVVDAVFDNLPHINAVREGRWDFQTLKGEYVCFYSTVWQALGIVLGDLLSQKDMETGQPKTAPQDFAGRTSALMTRIHTSGGWLLNAPIWSDPNRRVVTDKKVGTQKGDVSNAVKVLKDFLN